MARTPSRMIPLGTEAPPFDLVDTVSGRRVTLDSIVSEVGIVVMFVCNHCPFVKHVRSQLVSIANDYSKRGVSFVAISSNDIVAYPADGPDLMRQEAQEAGYPFPYLYDPTQEVARAYDATCTPDFFLFDAARKLVYRGQLDDSRPNTGIAVTGADLRTALDALISGRPISSEQKPSLGCNIKWRS